MLDFSGKGNGSGSGMLDLGANQAGQPAEVVDHPEPSRAQPEGGRGERQQKPVHGSPKGAVGHALMQGQGSGSAEASRGEPAFDEQSAPTSRGRASPWRKPRPTERPTAAPTCSPTATARRRQCQCQRLRGRGGLGR